MEERKCRKCGRVLHISNFNENKKSIDGYSHICKECRHEIAVDAKQKKICIPENSPLSAFTPRQLMEELRRRGYKGELTYIQKIDLEHI